MPCSQAHYVSVYCSSFTNFFNYPGAARQLISQHKSDKREFMDFVELDKVSFFNQQHHINERWSWVVQKFKWTQYSLRLLHLISKKPICSIFSSIRYIKNYLFLAPNKLTNANIHQFDYFYHCADRRTTSEIAFDYKSIRCCSVSFEINHCFPNSWYLQMAYSLQSDFQKPIQKKIPD